MAVSGKIKTVHPQPKASPAAAGLQLRDLGHNVQQESSRYEEGRPRKEAYGADWGETFMIMNEREARESRPRARLKSMMLLFLGKRYVRECPCTPA